MKPIYEDDFVTLYHIDARQWRDIISEHSIDLIFTDPPYLKEYLYLYEFLAKESADILSGGGFGLYYAGVYWKNIVMNYFDGQMEYFGDFVLVNGGSSPILWMRKIISRYKSILAYRNIGSKALPRSNVLTLWKGGGEDKRFHIWGQDESSARYYIDCFSKPGDLVFDPFCGGGTTPAICKRLKRRCIAFDTDGAALERSIERIEVINTSREVIQEELFFDLEG